MYSTLCQHVICTASILHTSSTNQFNSALSVSCHQRNMTNYQELYPCLMYIILLFPFWKILVLSFSYYGVTVPVVATVFSYVTPLSPKLLNLNNFVYFSVYRIRSLAVSFTLTYPFDVYWVMQMNNTSFFYAYNYVIIYFKYSLNLFS